MYKGILGTVAMKLEADHIKTMIPKKLSKDTQIAENNEGHYSVVYEGDDRDHMTKFLKDYARGEQRALKIEEENDEFIAYVMSMTVNKIDAKLEPKPHIAVIDAMMNEIKEHAGYLHKIDPAMVSRTRKTLNNLVEALYLAASEKAVDDVVGEKDLEDSESNKIKSAARKYMILKLNGPGNYTDDKNAKEYESSFSIEIVKPKREYRINVTGMSSEELESVIDEMEGFFTQDFEVNYK